MLERLGRSLKIGGRRISIPARTRRGVPRSPSWIIESLEHDCKRKATVSRGRHLEGAQGAIRSDNYGTGRTGRGYHGNLEFGFLYPLKSLDLLRRVSSRTSRRRYTSGGVHSSGKRLFSTANTPSNSSSNEELQASLPSLNNPGPRPLGDTSTSYIEAWKRMKLRRSDDEDPDSAIVRLDILWHHFVRDYQKVSRSQRIWMRSSFLRRVRREGNEKDWARIAAVMEEEASENRKSSERRALVQAYLTLQRTDDALDILRSNEFWKRQNAAPRDAGIEFFIAWQIERGNWELAAEAYKIAYDRGYKTIRTASGNSLLDFIHMAPITQHAAYVDRVLEWVSGVDTRSPKYIWYMAEDLLKGSMHFYSERPTWSEIWEDIWIVAKKKGFKISQHDYQRTLPWLIGCQEYAKARAVYMDFRSTGPIDVPMGILNMVLGACIKLRDFTSMQQVFNDIYTLSETKLPDRSSYNILMREMGKAGDVRATESLLEQYQERFALTSKEVSQAMHVNIVRGDTESAIAWFNKHSELGLEPDRIAYNILINAYRIAEDADSAYSSLRDMVQTGRKELYPDSYTYGTLMALASQRGDVETCESLLRIAGQEGQDLNIEMYGALAQAYRETNLPRNAEQVIIDIENKFRTETKTAVWNTVLSAYLSAGDRETLMRLHREMLRKQIPFDNYTYAILMHSLCMAGKVERAEALLENLKQQGTDLTDGRWGVNYSILMIAYLRNNDLEKVLRTFMKTLSDGVPASLATVAVLIQAYANAEYASHLHNGSGDYNGSGELELNTARRMLRELIEEPDVLGLETGTIIPPWVFVPVIHLFSRTDTVGMAEELFKQFCSQKPAKPSMALYQAMMLTYQRTYNTAGFLAMYRGFSEVALPVLKPASPGGQEQKVMPKNAFHFTKVLSMFIKHMSRKNDILAIEQEIEFLQGQGLKLDRLNWNDYAQALALSKDVKSAAAVCERILQYDMGGGLYVRTREVLAARLKDLQDASQRGDEESRDTMTKIQDEYPLTWNGIIQLTELEGRVEKERYFRKLAEERLLGATAL